MNVAPIDKATARGLVVRHHYSGKAPGARYAWGLYDGGEPVGCVLYSVPASFTLVRGVCGVGADGKPRFPVLELSRLVVTTGHDNAASTLVGRSLDALGKLGGVVVVSYADANDRVGHVGYVYQATNWLYTGRGNAEPAWVLESDPSVVVSYTRRHIDAKARALGFPWKEGASSGPGIVPVPQAGKHRYVTFAGDRRFRRDARRHLRYPVRPYPKGPTRRHDGPARLPGVPHPEARPAGGGG